ncbi:alpha/beta hydrolase [Chryseobacterium sp. CH21]|uniref:alpha/beta hydrolase n=1 Tax=Chryseobacterium sp. CH21 TaxID=713556 RepID=UPI0013E950CA|nr:alpha/beta hydrolase [Chryseobacterium sp. CH21]
MMKFKNIFAVVFSFFSMMMFGQKSEQKQYIFFLHNKFLEDHSFEEKHPKYGVAEYEAILNKLRNKNTIVISEKRKSDPDPSVYAKKVKKQIDSLMKKGIPAGRITIVGTSQGGYIAQYVSFYEKNSQLKFVFIGASFKDDSLEKDKNFKLYGRILSITEKSDEGHVLLSKEQRLIRSNIKDFKEIELNTGLHHGFLFKALNDWIAPTKDWISSE